MSVIDKKVFWDKICTCMKEDPFDLKKIRQVIAELHPEADNFTEVMRFCMDKTVGATDDHRMVEVMRLLMEAKGEDVLRSDEEFRQNLMKKAQIHENQFVVIYEDWTKAEAYLNVYHLLLEIK